MFNSKVALASVLFVVVGCGTDYDTENVYVTVPKPEVIENEVIVEKPVIVEKEVVVYRDAPVLTETVVRCHVLFTDCKGNLYRLSHDDMFLRNSELARQFTEAEADKIIEVKSNHMDGTLEKYCFEKTVVVKK